MKLNETILAISGSSRMDSSNGQLLNCIKTMYPDSFVDIYDGIHSLPLYSAAIDHHPWPTQVLDWRKKVLASKAVIICTPEYLHNLPASIKNALEWLASSGELDGKSVLPITFTPSPPRGEKAMKSLLWSLEALNARIVAQLDLYKTTVEIEHGKVTLKTEDSELINGALELLVSTRP